MLNPYDNIKQPLPAFSLLFEVLHLIEQQHAVRSSPDRLSELSTFLTSRFSRVPTDFPNISQLASMLCQILFPHQPVASWPRSQHSLVELQSNEKLQTSPCTLTCPQKAPPRRWNTAITSYPIVTDSDR